MLDAQNPAQLKAISFGKAFYESTDMRLDSGFEYVGYFAC